MDEISSYVFDILHPTPVSLKELSATAISIEIWRCEVDKYRRNRTLDAFNPSKLQISSKAVLPDLPSVIYDTIDEFVTRFGCSLDKWLGAHFSTVFRFHYSQKNYVLEDLDDFVCDYDGAIHYVRTAERMMRCDRFDMDKKFIIACTYCFEDDIRRIWPYVCEKVDSNGINFKESPRLFYWICCLKNELDKIPIDEENDTVDEEMLDNIMSHNRPSVEYFWNRLPLERRMRKTEDLLYYYEESFTRFILPKLDDHEIDKFINENKEDENLVEAWLGNRHYDEELILQLWMRVRNLVKESTFEKLVVIMLANSGMCYRGEENDNDDKITDNYIDMVTKKWTHLCSEMWNSAPDNLKRSTIEHILFESGLFNGLYDPSNVGFLLTILPFASFEDRSECWDYAWPALINRTGGEHLQRIMELCFKNEEQICQFKQNVMAKSKDVKKLCVSYLRGNCFEDAKDLVDFCCPEIHAARNLKQQLLQSAFLSQQHDRLEFGILFHVERFNDFINNAYESADQASEFRNRLVSSPFFQPYLLNMMPSHCKQLMEFVDAFVSSEETLRALKRQLIQSVKSYSLEPYGDTFLLWCLGSRKEVSEFKRNYIYFSTDSSDSSDDNYDEYESLFNLYDDCI